MASDLLQPKNRKRGRPAEPGTMPVQVRLKPGALSQLDAWRRDQADLPTRPEAIRRLVELALAKE